MVTTEDYGDLIQRLHRNPARADLLLERSIYSLIRDGRIAANLTQQQLANRIGVKIITVMKWEQGHYTPARRNLKKIAEELYGWLPGADEVLMAAVNLAHKEARIRVNSRAAALLCARLQNLESQKE